MAGTILVSEGSSLSWLCFFLMADLAARAVQKSSSWAMVLYSSVSVVLVLHRAKPEAAQNLFLLFSVYSGPGLTSV